MKLINFAIVTTIAFSLFFEPLSQAQIYTPESLEFVLERVQNAHTQGNHPVVIFDLDDTLINTRERNLRIIKDYIQQEPSSSYASTEEISKLANLGLMDIHYLITDTLRAKGIENPLLSLNLADFWLARFFTNKYSAADKQNSGAANYVWEIANAGGKIIYLSGRDVPRMQEGTIESLAKGGFPMNPKIATLMLKPDKAIPDLDFKKSAFAKISQLGEVVGVFENEPANLNAMVDFFPSAIAVFLDTIHSPAPAQPSSKALWVADFKHRGHEY